MFKTKDPYSYTTFGTLKNGSTVVGSIVCEYQVTYYDDVQLSDFTSVTQNKNRKYMLLCTQRVSIYNPTGMNLSPDTNLTSYNDYPAMINTSISIDPSAGISFGLLDYSPKTVNTQIQSSGTTGTSSGQTQESSNSNTIGSSTSQTNTYGASVTVGDISGVSEDYQYSSTVTNEQSSTNQTGASNSKNNESSNSASMSIKDWGAYALVNPNNKNPSWTFGQEYPWDAIECRKTTGAVNPSNTNQVQIVVPDAMLYQLYNGASLYPPSQLSTFGINFVMKSNWMVAVNNGTSDDVTIEHVINYFSGTHTLGANTSGDISDYVLVYMDKQPSSLSSDQSLSAQINLALLALDPLNTRNQTAIIGFIPNKFITQPAPATSTAAPVPFKIISTSNNLMILDTTTYPSPCDAGAGFSASETALTASFAEDCTSLQMTMYFKVVDSVNDYTLYLKHWKTGTNGVMLTFVINGDTSNPITYYVDAAEAEGGDDNLLSIVLRNQDFSTVYYYDYLQLGLNSIQVTIQPIGGTYVAGSDYQIRAVSIEKS